MTNQELAIENLIDERRRQDAQWGEQDHSDGVWALILGEEFGEACQAALQNKFGGRNDLIGEAGKIHLKKELTHVAAVAIAWIEAIDRRKR